MHWCLMRLADVMHTPARQDVGDEGSPQAREEGRVRWQDVFTKSLFFNVMGRTERALRMALGGALIMALTMCDLPNMDYSFKYIGPFLFFVVGTLAPPLLSTAVIILFAGLFCILLACAVATGLLSCLLVSSGGQALCIIVFALFVFWASFLTTSKTKEMTLIGSYILLYAVPLATLVASPYASDGIKLVLTPERYGALKQFMATSSIAAILDEASSFLLMPPDVVAELVAKLTSPSAVQFLQRAAQSLQIQLPALPTDQPLTPQQVMGLLFTFFESLPPNMPVSVEMKPSRNAGLNLSQDWMYDVPLFVEGVVGQQISIGARPGAWFIKTIWVASGPIGMLRNLIIFAFLGFAIYLLVMLVPPIRRQRDVAIRDMANACRVIRRALRTVKSKLATTENANDQAVGDGDGACQREHNRAHSGEALSRKAEASDSEIPAANALENAILSLLDAEKAILLSGMEPFLLYPGPGVWTMKVLDAVRKRLIQCCVQTQHMLQLLHHTENPIGSMGSNPQLAAAGRRLLAKCINMYELCEDLLTTFPSIFSPSKSKKKAEELMQQMSLLEKEMRTLAMEVSRPSETDTENALVQLKADTSALSRSNTEQLTDAAQVVARTQSFARAVEILPVGLAVTAFVQACYSEPLWLSRVVCALSKAQQVNTLHGFVMNLAFPFIPVVVHLKRLVIAPMSALAVWRHQWRGQHAWWKDPEAWYVIKLVIPLIVIFSCGLCLPKLLQYSWGVEVTSSPVFLDYSEQGVTTRMVPWFLLGYLTVLQTTYNGTAHRGLARTLGILLGSFFGWVALSWYESVAALIAFCAVTVFVDIFAFADRHHPLDGFSRRWGYIGMVFTYTQGLIVTLASEELGGLTGDRDYLVTTRILSNVMGILLAILVSHLPPLASATTCACSGYSRVIEGCTKEANTLTRTFLAVCSASKDGHEANAADTNDATEVFSASKDEIAAVIGSLDSDVKEQLGTTSMLLREGSYVPVLQPWQADVALSKVKVAATSMLLEAYNAAQLVKGLLEDLSETTAATDTAVAEARELELLPMAGPAARSPSSDGNCGVPRSWSVCLLQHGNFLAIKELFRCTAGGKLREALSALCSSLSTLAKAANVELCKSFPAFGDKLMCHKGRYTHQSDSPESPELVYESCRSAVDSDAQRVIQTLVECLGSHFAEHRLSSTARTASAFVVMKLLHHLQNMKFSMDEVHAAAVKGASRANRSAISYCLPTSRTL